MQGNWIIIILVPIKTFYIIFYVLGHWMHWMHLPLILLYLEMSFTASRATKSSLKWHVTWSRMHWNLVYLSTSDVPFDGDVCNFNFSIQPAIPHVSMYSMPWNVEMCVWEKNINFSKKSEIGIELHCPQKSKGNNYN